MRFALRAGAPYGGARPDGNGSQEVRVERTTTAEAAARKERTRAAIVAQAAREGSSRDAATALAAAALTTPSRVRRPRFDEL